MWLRPFWGKIFPDLLPFACSAIVLAEVVSCLYRFDRQSDLARQLETFKPFLLPVSESDEDEGQRVVVPPFLLIVKQRLKDLQGVRPTLTYSNLAVIVAFLWFALPSVVLEYFFVRPPLSSSSPRRPFHCYPWAFLHPASVRADSNALLAFCFAQLTNEPLAPILPAIRVASFGGTLVTIPLAIGLLAWLKGDLYALWSYEEDWGTKLAVGEVEEVEALLAEKV